MLGGIAIMVVGLIILLGSTFGQVGTSQRGIVLMGGAPTGGLLNEGFYFKVPLLQSVEVMDVSTQVVNVHKVEAASNDLQSVTTDVSVSYSLNPAKVIDVYRAFRRDFEKIILAPAVQDGVKAATAKFGAEKLVQQRQAAKEEVTGYLKGVLEANGLHPQRRADHELRVQQGVR